MSKEMIEKLLPCPFCGAAAEMQPWHGGGPDKQLISCSEHAYECDVGPSVTGETPEEAAAAWNKRSAYNPNERLPELTDAMLEAGARAFCETQTCDPWEMTKVVYAAMLSKIDAALSPLPQDDAAELRRAMIEGVHE